jgi:DNA-3-methyladenine glycosylase
LPVETMALARALVGWHLVRRSADGVTSGRIVETEAYLVGDPASHAFRGVRPRTLPMFGPPFHAYIYRIYGRYQCFNVTSESHGIGAGVLVRALEPLQGIELMRERRGVEPLRELCSGPGRLSQALAIGMELNGRDLMSDPELALEPPERPVGTVGRSRRIGISHVQAARRLLRFYERGSVYVSGPRWLSP